MPVTVRPSSKTAESWGAREQRQSEPDTKFTLATSPEQLLSSITSNDGDKLSFRGTGSTPKPKQIVQSSFSSLSHSSSTIFATKNGFVHACIEAYNEHHNLVLRPEDVWFAILTQLSAYINANADALRSHFVSRSQGQKELHIDVELDDPTLNHGEISFHMTKLMSDSLKDPDLRDWILPGFSTTEKPDQAVASIIFMGTMQRYFTYSWGTRCGIPSVTLLGEVEDWIEIAERCASRLGTGGFGSGPRTWYTSILRLVLAGFVESFHEPEGRAAQKFWKGIVDKHTPNGSGCVTYSGWITAFCYWDEKGECLHGNTDGGGGGRRRQRQTLELSRSEIPMGFTKVPVTLLDNGVRIPTEMVAGSVGIGVRKSVRSSAPVGGDEESFGSRRSLVANSVDSPTRSSYHRHRWEGYDNIQPETGWFMYLV
ncbi:hypothetical protein B0H66DRAFT_567286 [Apodospora peruviana]|uniref:Uncharacterized protein n=1 Tax=Apodospora peruviana TaxID=516989 RepID=A0AAE0HWH8_9PEZI|nr:hypothetical protein B0H66DRAFT_567286 [Apodospora peruviana]